jgi:hypothetical protein
MQCAKLSHLAVNVRNVLVEDVVHAIAWLPRPLVEREQCPDLFE